MYDVFISYKKERVAAVAHLASILEAHGYTVWFDVRGLPYGPSFGPEIEKALRASSVTLVLWCSLSKGSEWVIEEASLAKKLGRYLPAHMEPDPAPLGYRNDQAIQLADWDGDPNGAALDALFDELEKRTGKSPLANRRMTREIEQRWNSAGRPGFAASVLATGLPSEATLKRAFAPMTDLAEAPPVAAALTKPSPSADAWREVKGSQSLADYDHFLIAFPDAPETEACKQARAGLAEVLELASRDAARLAEFAALPAAGYDPQPIDAFVTRHAGTTEAFRAARLASDVRARVAASAPDKATRERWELEAAVSLVTGQAIPPERAPHLKILVLDGADPNLFNALRASRADLTAIYEKPNGTDYERRLKWRDLAPLSRLNALTVLDLGGTQVSNLDSLEGLTALTKLSLWDTQVSNLDPLKGLTALTELSLGGTQVSNLDPLKGLTALTKLSLWYTQVSNLDPFKGLTALKYLDVRGTRVSNLDPLKGLTALTYLDLRGTLVSNLDPLKGLTALTKLDLWGTEVSNLDPLKELFALTELDLKGTQVSNLDAVEHVAEIIVPNGTKRKGKRAP